MYCPRCAAQNLDDAKFCRSCGTNLEVVSLALSGQPLPAKADKKGKDKEKKQPARTRAEKRVEGVSNIVQGGGLLGASLLVGAALGLFSNQPDWIFVWLVFVGWMACWGVISLVSGVGALVESRLMPHQAGPADDANDAEARLPPAVEPGMLPDASTAPELYIPTSVTEHTTEPLLKERPKSKRAG